MAGINKAKTPKAATFEASRFKTQQGNETMNNNTENNQICTAPVIAGVSISTDTEGRFNLNALHKASGLGEEKAPAKWLRNKQAKELVQELIDGQICPSPIDANKGGIGQGTFAHELLAISYAGWISPAFQLKVNQVFLDYRTGKLAPTSIDPMQALNDPATMRGLLLGYTEKVLTLEHKVEEMRPDVEAFERISKAEGSMCITDAAKHLQVQPRTMFKTLSERRWIYRRTGGKSWVGYQDKIQQGCLEHKVTTVSRGDGSEKVVEQVLVTAKGLTKLSQLLCGAAL